MARSDNYEYPPYYITAYGIAVKHGYEGTEEEWITEIMTSGAAAAESAEAAETAKTAAESAEEKAAQWATGGTTGTPGASNNAKYYSQQASASATAADGSAKDAEAYAVGKRGGTDVGEADPAYHNNAKYYVDQLSDAVATEVAADVGTWLEANVDPETGYVIDKSLSVPNAAADAKRVGEKIDGLNGAFLPTEFAPTITENAYISSTTGKTASSSSGKYARTGLWNGKGYRIAVELANSAYELAVFYYDATGSVSSGTGYIGYSGYRTGRVYIPQSAILFGLSFHRVDDTAMTEADITAIQAALSAYQPTDVNLATRGISADAKFVGDAMSRIDLQAVDGLYYLNAGQPSAQATYRGVTIKSYNGHVLIDGENTGDAYSVKLSNDFDYNPAGGVPNAWKAENIDLINGHTYSLLVYVESGTVTTTDSAVLAVVMRNGNNETVASTFVVNSNGTVNKGYRNGGRFVAEAGNHNFIFIIIRGGTTYNNLRFRLMFRDETVMQQDAAAEEAANQDGFGDVEDRKFNSVFSFTNDWRYDNITLTKGIYTNSEEKTTHYYLVTIPKFDSKGNLIPITADYDTSLSPMKHAAKYKTCVTANAGMISGGGDGYVIHNGEVVRERDYSSSSFLVYVGFDSERTVYEFPANTTAAAMLTAGIKNACIAYYRLVTAGVVRDVSDIGLPESNLGVNPRMSMFLKENGDVCFLACDGRYPDEEGLTPPELGDLMVSLGAVDGWNLDGGGSTSLSYNGVKQNRHIDSSGTVDRNIHVTWNVPGITPDYILPVCEQEYDATYRLVCRIAGGKKDYLWVRES